MQLRSGGRPGPGHDLFGQGNPRGAGGAFAPAPGYAGAARYAGRRLTDARQMAQAGPARTVHCRGHAFDGVPRPAPDLDAQRRGKRRHCYRAGGPAGPLPGADGGGRRPLPGKNRGHLLYRPEYFCGNGGRPSRRCPCSTPCAREGLEALRGRGLPPIPGRRAGSYPTGPMRFPPRPNRPRPCAVPRRSWMRCPRACGRFISRKFIQRIACALH